MLPLYELIIHEKADSNLEVSYVALVDEPAIEKTFLKFRKQEPVQLNFALTDTERRIISGPCMLANVPIYRRDDDGFEYNVFFTPETIYKIVQKVFEKQNTNNFNIMHNPNMKVDDVFMFESFIVDSKRGIKPMVGYEDAEDGSWFISAIVKNDEVWQRVCDGTLKGFSVEGFFSMKEEDKEIDSALKEVLKSIGNILNEINHG